jgi:hypothetical protein
MGDDKRITVIVPKEMHLALKLEAAKRETSVSHILRALISDWLEAQAEKSVQQARDSA